MKITNYRGDLINISARKEASVAVVTGVATDMSVWTTSALATIVVGGRHFWLFCLVRVGKYMQYTFSIYHVYTLCIYTTMYIFSEALVWVIPTCFASTSGAWNFQARLCFCAAPVLGTSIVVHSLRNLSGYTVFLNSEVFSQSLTHSCYHYYIQSQVNW